MSIEELPPLFVRLTEGAILPTRAHLTDAGLDIYSVEPKTIKAHEGEVIKTGLHIKLPKNTAGLLVSKSGLNVHYNITSTGLIDEGYTGEIMVKLYNHGNSDYQIKKGDKISQLVIIPVLYSKVVSCETLEDTERGTAGFGSTGR